MNESAAAPAAQSENAASQETGAEEEKPTRERRRLRLPTSVLMTLVGIALTAWLLPAFTKQWEDRRRADELKAALAGEIATATAEAVIGHEQQLQQELGDFDPLVVRVANEWSLRSLQIQARLRAYFSPELLTAWQLYSYLIGRVAATDRHQTVSALISVSLHDVRLDRKIASEAAELLATLNELQEGHYPPDPSVAGKDPGPSGPFNHMTYAGWLMTDLIEVATPDSDRNVRRIVLNGRSEFESWERVELSLLHLQQLFIDELLKEQPADHSTTARDLLDDLFP